MWEGSETKGEERVGGEDWRGEERTDAERSREEERGVLKFNVAHHTTTCNHTSRRYSQEGRPSPDQEGNTSHNHTILYLQSISLPPHWQRCFALFLCGARGGRAAQPMQSRKAPHAIMQYRNLSSKQKQANVKDLFQISSALSPNLAGCLVRNAELCGHDRPFPAPS